MTPPNDPTPHPGVAPVGYWKREHLTRPLRLADLTDDLLWPRLLKSGPMAMRPERMVIALFTVIALALVWRLPSALPDGEQFNADFTAVVARHSSAMDAAWALGGVGAGLPKVFEFFVMVPATLAAQHPWFVLLLVALSAPVLAIGGGAISRMTACEFSRHELLGWTEGVGFAVGRARSLIGALLLPPTVAAVLLLVLACAGWVLLNWTGVNLLGAAVYPLFLVGALAVVLAMVGFGLGHMLLVPAVACESTDGIDAVQRAYAYVIASPLRLFVYVCILVAQLAVLGGALAGLAALTVGVARWASTGFTGPEVMDMLSGGATATGVWRAGARIVEFWLTIPAALVASFVLSFVFSGSTVLYLLLRRLNDGQDPAEIWTPNSRNPPAVPPTAGGGDAEPDDDE